MSKAVAVRTRSVLPVYLISLVSAAAMLWAIAEYGANKFLPAAGTVTALEPTKSIFEAAFNELAKNFNSPFAGLILQVVTVLLVARVFGLVFRWIGQPRVIGEILAGIFLGPSLLKIIAPELQAALFPASSLQRLFFLSNFGLILFMFTIGLELNLKTLASRARSALLISHMSIIIPFVLGSGLALFLFDEFGPKKYGFLAFAMFMGISMSITAFPVLARIIQEHRLTKTPMGTAALTAAAVDDVTAWCILAAVVGIVRSGSATGAIAVVFLGVVYTASVVFLVRPLLARHLRLNVDGSDQIPGTTLAIVFLLLLISSLMTETIGIHALFGAFIAGVIMPENSAFKEKIAGRIHDVSTLVLLPLFFAFTGLRTEIGLLNDAHSALICALIVAVAVAGKMGGSIFAARWTGLGWRESAGLGALMNTRGLVELIVLNIGYDLGILTPKIFTMLVIMAVLTTMMTGPLLRLFGIVGRRAAALPAIA